MLDYPIINHFFEKYPKGHINIVQSDCVFKLTNDITYFLDESSITFMGIWYTNKLFGNTYSRKGNFMIPFKQVLRIEYIVEEKTR